MRTDHNLNDNFTKNQWTAFATLAFVAVWAAAAFWLHLTTLGGMDRTEMIFLGTIAPMCLILLPLYGKRYRWSYLGGVLVLLGLFFGVILEASDRVFVFSWSIYNVFVVLALAAAVACIYFSVRSYMERPSMGLVRTILGFVGLVGVTAVIATILSANADPIRLRTVMNTLDKMEARLDELETIDEKVQYLVDAGDYPSAVAGIVVNDSLVWSGAYGDASLDTVFEIGSVTKPFVATAVLQLHERGLVDLNADVNTYLPFALRHPGYPDTPVTIRMLLSHQSGLAHFTDEYHGYHYSEAMLDWLKQNNSWNLPRYQPSPEFANFIKGYLVPGGEYYTPNAWTNLKPGTAFHYSTPGYDILAYIVERVSGQPFPQYLNESVFVPLNMTSSGLSVQDFPERQAIPHWRIFGVLSQTNLDLPLYDFRTVGGGGMVSSLPDLAQFMIAQLNQGEVNGTMLLKPETIGLMQARSISVPKGAGDINQAGYGLGITHLNNQPWQYWEHTFSRQGAIGHGGSTGSSSAQLWFVPQGQGGYGIIFLTNVDQLKPDYYSEWFFATQYKIQVLLMEEAASQYQQSVKE